MFGLFGRKKNGEGSPEVRVAVADLPSKFEDKYIVCQICGDEFLFEAGEAEYYASVPPEKGGPLSEPRRCQSCRRARRLARNKGGNGNGHND